MRAPFHGNTMKLQVDENQKWPVFLYKNRCTKQWIVTVYLLGFLLELYAVIYLFIFLYAVIKPSVLS